MNYLVDMIELSEIQVNDIYIVTVPTPIDKDLTPLIKASEKEMIYVYPGATEEDFFCGYSPERYKNTKSNASIITAGTHLAPTIKVAEAAKVIEI